MKQTLFATIFAAAVAATSLKASAQMKDPDVSGAPMYPKR